MIYTPTEMALRNECEQLKKELAQVKAQYQACRHLLSLVMDQPTDMQVALDKEHLREQHKKLSDMAQIYEQLMR